MTFSAIASLVSGKRPVWLYEFTIGGSVSRYTSHGEDYTYDSQTWNSTPVIHNSLRQTLELSRSDFMVTLPKSNAFAQAVIDGAGILATRVRVFKGYANDGDQEFLLRFDGRIVGFNPFIGTTTLICENVATKLRRRAQPAVMQRPCRHALYHGGCGLAIGDWEASATATAWASPVLTVTEAAEQADGYYSGGMITFDGKRQMIRKHAGTSLTLLAPLPGLSDEITASGSATVAIAPGCDRTRATCNDRFDNILNYGGFPWMLDTPYDGRNPF